MFSDSEDPEECGCCKCTHPGVDFEENDTSDKSYNRAYCDPVFQSESVGAVACQVGTSLVSPLREQRQSAEEQIPCKRDRGMCDQIRPVALPFEARQADACHQTADDDTGWCKWRQ